MNFENLLNMYGSCEDDGISLNDFYRNSINDMYSEGDEFVFTINNTDIVIFTCLEQYGGEGLGNTYFVVFNVKFNDQDLGNYKLDGWYTSYDGHEFYDWKPYEVEKKEVVREEWFRKK